MNTKAIAIVVAAVSIGIVAFTRYRAGSEAIPPGSVVPPSIEVSQTDGTPADFPDTTPAAVTPMTLSITSPTNGSTVTSSSVSVRGRTVPKADVFVNELEGKADASGNFAISVTLDEGENYFVVLANDEFGNAAEAELTVSYAP